jgi:dihydroceramidase
MPFSIHRSELPHDPMNGNGYWGSATATLDWCEENYVVTPLIAEFWNTISNFNYIVLGFIGLWSCYRVKSELRDYMSVFSSILLIGLGSSLFHMTLMYPLQLSDELPMVYGVSCLVYCLINMFPPDRYSKITAIALSLYSIIVTVVYEYTRSPTFFQLCYTSLAFVAILVPFRNIWKLSLTNPTESRICLKAHLFSMVAYIFGSFLWMIDNLHCDELRVWRMNAPYPLHHFAQFHAWWHLMTGIGGFGTTMLSLYMRQICLGRENLQLVYFGPYPRVIVKEKVV